MSERRVVSVSRLLSYIRTSMESDPVLSGVLVEGEISNLRQPYSGHWYFSLKDSSSSMNCVMFASSNRNVRFEVKNGTKVVVRGNVSIYPAQGSLQLVVTGMKPAGIGDLYQQLELLKKKLAAQGLFDPAHKKQLPLYPSDIALVTGNNTAAREDVLITVRKRWPVTKITEYPCPVQGMDAPPKIIEALKKADMGGHQLIMLVRGGGSIEDLWCFNDESLARFIYAMNTPVITGIGHETDFTLADFTADVRANTPTGAVETALPDIHEVLQDLGSRKARIRTAAARRLSYERQRLDRYASHPVIRNPQRLYSDWAMRLDTLREKLMHTELLTARKRTLFHETATRFTGRITGYTRKMDSRISDNRLRLAMGMKQILAGYEKESNALKDSLDKSIAAAYETRTNRLSRSAALLDAYSPLKVLARGYSIAMKDSKTVRSVRDVDVSDMIDIRVTDGLIRAAVDRTEETDGTGKERNDI